MIKTITSIAGREYSITHNSEMGINIIMDCMTQEAMDDAYEDKHICFNYVGYIPGNPEDIDSQVITECIEDYEKDFTIKGFDYETSKTFEIIMKNN